MPREVFFDPKQNCVLDVVRDGIGVYGGRTLDQIKFEEGDHVVVISEEDAWQREADAAKKPPREITLDDWWYFLEVLPPRRWERRGISESFYMSEFCTLNITTHLVKVQDRCFMLDDECTKTHDQVVEMCKPLLMQPKPELTNHYARDE